jgi:hypothetical protein
LNLAILIIDIIGSAISTGVGNTVKNMPGIDAREISGLENNLSRLTLSPMSSTQTISVGAVYFPEKYEASFLNSS